MDFLDLTLTTGAENVALDEALLDRAEAGLQRETLRLWELPRPVVVIGRSSRLTDEVRVAECRRQGIEIVRRTSGGAAIVAGPGCLMYSLILSSQQRPELRQLDRAHTFVLDRLAEGIGRLLPSVQRRGTSDLAISNRKFSGNSLRCKRDWLLYHGTLLYAADLELIESLLGGAPRQPDYRDGRSHLQFVANLPLPRERLAAAVRQAFAADAAISTWPQAETERLVSERYGNQQWTSQR